MFGKELLITKYPFLGYSDILIEYFSIIGYTEVFIPELISTFKLNQTNTNTNNNTNNINQSTLKNKNPYRPTVLSSITSKNDYGIIDNELIITQLFPDNPRIILYENNQPEPEKSSVIYSFCFDSSDGKKKLFYTCFGYLFYELYKIPNQNSDEAYYYIPKAFCIISQYPFFNTFYLICKNIYNMIMNKLCKVPLEILIYNIVNYVPSPMNSNLELCLFGNEKEYKKILLNQLNGYPIIDFDLYEIFNLLPLNLIIEIYIFIFLEQSVLFFSSNLELLNIIMYIFFLFNYPVIDSIYYWHIVSVSRYELIDDNKFVGKPTANFLGINVAYNESINTQVIGRNHHIVDIDNKKLYYKEYKELNISLDDDDKTNLLVNYIENILKEKNVTSNYLRQPLINLKNHLETFLGENVTNFSSNPKKNYVNFFKDEIKNMDRNKKILEFFYDCNLTLLTEFYNDNELNTSFDLIINKEKNNLSDSSSSNIKHNTDAEKIFLDTFRSTIKYKIYFETFMKDFEIMDVFKIPFLFSDKFIELKLNDKEHNIICCDNIDYFNIIDHLYKLTNKQIKVRNINFNNFNRHYTEKLSIYFNSFYISEYDHKMFDQNDKNMIKTVNRPEDQLINLNKKRITRYLYLLKNYYEKKNITKIFPQTSIIEEKIKIMDRRIINQVIKNNLIEKKFINSFNFLIYSLVYVVCLTIPFHSFDKMVKYFVEIQESMKLIKFFKRDYIYTLTKSIYKYYLLNRKTKKYPNMVLTHVKMYLCFLATFIRQNNILPNEEMMLILTDFFGDTIYQEREELNDLDEEKQNNLNQILNDNINKEDLYDTNQYLFYIKFCFSSKGTIKKKVLIQSGMEDSGNFNALIKKCKRAPEILIKIKDYIYSCKFFHPYKIYKDAENLFEDFFDNYELDFSSLNIQKLREIILNLIIYGSEIDNKSLPLKFLINTLYTLQNFEDYYFNKENNGT